MGLRVLTDLTALGCWEASGWLRAVGSQAAAGGGADLLGELAGLGVHVGVCVALCRDSGLMAVGPQQSAQAVSNY